MSELLIKNDPDDIGRVLAVMLHRQPSFQDEYVLDTSGLMGSDGSIDLDPQREKLVGVSPSLMQLPAYAAYLYKRAVVAGKLISTIYLMDRLALDEPSMNKAIFVTQEWATSHKFGDRTSPLRSEAKIRECWDEFESTAHLWGAFVLNLEYQVLGSQDPFSTKTFPAFLSLAADIWDFGVTFQSQRSVESELLLERMTSYWLPQSVSPVGIGIDRCSSKLVDVLSRYQAPSSI
jgi:hypothetical protein